MTIPLFYNPLKDEKLLRHCRTKIDTLRFFQ